MKSCLYVFLLLLFPLALKAGNLEDEILRYTNKYRAAQGKKPLQMDASAQREAERHSRDMARGETGFGHGGFNERAARVKKSLGRLSGVAENVAYGDLNAEEVVQGWIKSKPHRKNMLGDYTLIGIGVARRKDGRLYFTQLFIKP